MKFNVKHKVRFDRGRVYYSYMNAIFTAGLVFIFSQGNWINSVLSSVAVMVIIYLFGWVDQGFNILKREQQYYSEQNPTLMKILKEIEEIKAKL